MRKQAFVTAYAVGLYVHFLLNLGVAGYLLVVIVHATRADTKALCQNAISNTQGQDQCSTVFNAIRGAYAALASLILVIELCESFPHPIPPTYSSVIDGAIVATRYVYQVRAEKREARTPRYVRVQPVVGGGQPSPGFVRYDGIASGTKVYSAYYQDHIRAPSAAYSPANTDFEGASPMELYDPPTASKSHVALELEDRYKVEEFGLKDMDGPYGHGKTVR